jgi:hypothetical protein
MANTVPPADFARRVRCPERGVSQESPAFEVSRRAIAEGRGFVHARAGQELG